MSKKEIMNLIKGEGLTDYQAELFMADLDYEELETEEQVFDAVREWIADERLYERCGLTH